MPFPATKMANVGVAPVVIVVVTLSEGGDRQLPVLELVVSQMDNVTGKAASPVSAVTVISALEPTFTDAVANALFPKVPGRLMIPSFVGVTDITMMSGTGVFDAESNNVFIPGNTQTGALLLQSKIKGKSVGVNAALGVIAKTNVCKPPAIMSVGVLGVPVGALVTGSVV